MGLSVAEATKSEAMDYKERFIALMDEMFQAGMAGCIPMVIGEGLRECEAYSKDLAHWVKHNIDQHC